MYCSYCGKSLPDTAKTCTQCGSLLKKPMFPEKNEDGTDFVPPKINTPNYETNPISSDISKPIDHFAPVVTMWQYVLILFLINLPVVGIILLIVFALDGTNRNRANFCRAHIVYSCLATVFWLLVSGIAIFLFASALDDSIAQLIERIGSMLEIYGGY